MRLANIILTLTFVFSATGAVRANTLNVPDDYPTIQAGINAASHGDTVLVAPGVYTGSGNRDIYFYGRQIVVMSEKGPEVTIIDCQASPSDRHRGFVFNSGEDESSVLQGFTITNGFADGGGGAIRTYYTAPTIKGNIIKGNGTDSSGGGIEVWYTLLDAAPVIIDNIITGNEAPSGGGIHCWGTWDYGATIVGNTIVGNTATSRGGGIYTWAGASPIIDCNTFSDNSAEYGGAIYCGVDCSLTVKNSILWDDYADHGQEIYMYEGASVTVSYSDVDGGWTGTGNINSDPEFLLPSKNDYRLLWESPCIDAAQPGYYDPDATRLDMGAHCFDQDDYITLYITPDATEAVQGGQLGVTYTFINTNGQSEQYILLTQVVLPNNSTLNVIGPKQKTTAAGTTSQVYETHNIPPSTPTNTYEYWSRIGVAPSTLYDEDSFMFRIVEP